MLERNKRMLGYRRLFQEELGSKTKKPIDISLLYSENNWTATWFLIILPCATFVPSKRKQYKSIEVSSNDSLIHASF